ncbi:MAG: molybdopterin-dependent oxidoreductase [Desulfobacterales bacterium]|uniref:Molybdopterin-dependent oxidoreductase n=1 Tax=Candidatus Desulfaltia bathyphila TaxID=2841697 RepID=A0A8J6T6K1_9BACT|nr:molybdopterin-dependent oxidoreductase [Candidatus Desulfaltia bathyphila]MBL7195828.1 molybdopterin-dependent oxidoreductase [Desulfobacterales bacterium]MBL7207864.1 molybdopterin-dependent oxidoreductase [Desulfobacterales bacterium]
MKVCRRSFLSLIIGGAAGTTLSPLPLKMMDDSSIWTQMWPWTPVPEDGEVSHVDSICTLCPGGCGITVRKVATTIGDRAIKIEGMKGHPVNDGGICVLGLSGLQLLYGPTRVKTPLKRAGARGEGRWEKISWDEAIAEVVKKLGELRGKGKSHTVACISGTDSGTTAHLLGRFLTVYGSPNFIRIPSIQDSYELTMHLMQGVQASAGFDVENSDFVLSFGSGLIEGWGSPVRMIKANSMWKERGKVVQIESRLSNTAAKADKWVAINPGTEAALALSIAHVIIQKSLYSADFVNNYSSGFEEFKQIVLNEFSPDDVSEITGVSASTIESLAKSFAGASKPLAVCGRGQGETPGSLNEFIAVHALNALVGNINKKGGVCAVPDPDYIKWPEVEMDRTAANGMHKGRIDGAGSKKYPDTRYLLDRLPDAINSGEKYPIEALFVAGANPVYTIPDTKAVKEAFNRVAFVVSFSSYMDETAENADLILPNHVFLERYEDVPTPVGLQKPIIGLSKPVVKPQFNTKHLGDVILLMAKSFGGRIADAFPWDSYEACLKKTLGNKWDGLVNNGFWADSNFRPAAWEGAFNTPSGKFEFVNKGRAESIKIEGDEQAYPLILMPYDSMRLASGFIGDPPFAIKTVEDTVLKGNDIFVEVNPRSARGFREGDHAILSTPKGSVKVRVHHFDGIMPGLVALPRGLGHTAYDEYLAGKGINFNELIGPVEDPVSGLNVAWGIRAKLTRA